MINARKTRPSCLKRWETSFPPPPGRKNLGKGNVIIITSTLLFYTQPFITYVYVVFITKGRNSGKFNIRIEIQQSIQCCQIQLSLCFTKLLDFYFNVVLELPTAATKLML